jgi:carboxyl-terminal processing protease
MLLWAEVSFEPTRQDVLLNHIIRQQLTHLHFDRDAHPIDDNFSKEAFSIFIKRVDYQKMLLLKKDVESMKSMLTSIDDDFNKGTFHLPAMAAEMVLNNLKELEPYCEELLKGSFDYDKEEHFETDPDKMDFCQTMEELKDRRRQYLKYQCLGRYLNSIETEKVKLELEQKKASEAKSKEIAAAETEQVQEVTVKTASSNVVISEEKDRELRDNARDKTLEQIKSYFKRLRELNHQEHYSRYFNALTAGFDPHTNYMDPATKEDFSIRMSKSLQGIGAVLQEEDDFTKIMRIVPGSASYRQGELKAGDIILRVAEGDSGEEVDITGMRLREVVTYIRGEKGTVVRLTVKKADGSIKVIAIVRDIVKLEDALAKSTTVKTDNNETYGYVYLPDFYRDVQDPSSRNCTDDVRNEINALKKQGIKGLIFDLRGNGGGFLEDARTIAGLFISSGPIVQVKDHQSKVMVLRDEDNIVDYDGPMVMLVDQFSASASEILAAALQDYNRAVIVGSSQTHGKGTVQHLLSLDQQVPDRFRQGEELGSLKLTIQKFYRINGGSTQIEGVHPDIVLPDDKNYLESEERFLDYALPYDKISSVKYRPWSSGLPLDALRANSKVRVEKNDVFKAIGERGQRLQTRAKETVVTLSRAAMIKEREDAKAETDSYQKLLDDLKSKLDPIAFAQEQKEKAQAEEVAASGNTSVVENNDKTPEEIHAEEYKKWQEGVRFDPYVRESMAILGDLITLSGAAVVKK